jgi:hypothetical protein
MKLLWPFGKRSQSCLSPDEFKQRIAAINNGGVYDPEEAHQEVDSLMAETLRGLGYGDGIDISDEMQFWYA